MSFRGYDVFDSLQLTVGRALSCAKNTGLNFGKSYVIPAGCFWSFCKGKTTVLWRSAVWNYHQPYYYWSV